MMLTKSYIKEIAFRESIFFDKCKIQNAKCKIRLEKNKGFKERGKNRERVVVGVLVYSIPIPQKSKGFCGDPVGRGRG